MNIDFLQSSTFQIIQVIVAVIITAVCIKLFFPTKSNGVNNVEVSSGLEKISKKLLINHLESIMKGELVSKQHIASEFLPILTDKMAEFKSIINNGVQIKSEVKNLDQANITVIKKDDNTIKLKISALFRHDYYHNGRLLDNPGDLQSYIPEDKSSQFYSSYYIFNFKLIGESDHQLIGITDNIIGNDYGEV